MALTPDHIPGPALDMGGLSPEAEQDIELGAALYWGRVAADGALQPPHPPILFKDQSRAGQVLVPWLGQSR